MASISMQDILLHGLSDSIVNDGVTMKLDTNFKTNLSAPAVRTDDIRSETGRLIIGGPNVDINGRVYLSGDISIYGHLTVEGQAVATKKYVDDKLIEIESHYKERLQESERMFNIFLNRLQLLCPHREFKDGWCRHCTITKETARALGCYVEDTK